ncbi:MAG: TVP38/TMEM64 family protein [Limnobacter sp.]|nr:TVP38/TMEM64 family protein [Limnobacter sp.]
MWEELRSIVMTCMQLFEQAPVLFSILYVLAFTGLTALCLPGASVLMLACGACMGFTWGTVLSNLASASGALLTMLIARYFLHDWVHNKWGGKLSRLKNSFRQDEVAWMISLRLAPVVPFAVLNGLVGLTKIRPWTFWWTSFVGMLPGTAVYVYAGSALGQVQKAEELWTLEVMLGLAAMAILPWILKGLEAKWRKSQTAPEPFQ